MNQYLISYSAEKVSQHISIRDGETKLGQAISYGNDFNNKAIKYVFVGIPEDIGPVANHGKPGAKNAWNAFLGSFLNTQKNKFIDTSSIHILGEIKTQDLYDKLSEDSTIEDYQKLVPELDKRVLEVVSTIKQSGKTPIIIGGGHNNCYPIIKGVSKAVSEPLNILNIDPHADLRAPGKRHSGNGFTYALNEKFINKYFILGLHEEYNSEYIIEKIENNPNINYYSFNSFLKEDNSAQNMVEITTKFFQSQHLGLEIDLDSIAYMPVSAKTPSGFSLDFIRKNVLELSKKYNFQYIHICEGAPQNVDQDWVVGKAISYLINDIIKTN